MLKKVFVDDYIFVDEYEDDAPIFSKIGRPNSPKNTYGVFQLLEKALAKVLKEDIFFRWRLIENKLYEIFSRMQSSGCISL